MYMSTAPLTIKNSVTPYEPRYIPNKVSGSTWVVKLICAYSSVRVKCIVNTIITATNLIRSRYNKRSFFKIIISP